MIAASTVDLPAEPNAALIALLGVVVVALSGVLWYVIKSKPAAMPSEEVEALRAVVGRIEEDVAKLVAAELEFQSKGWTTLPPDLASSAGLTAAIYELRRDVSEMREFLKRHDEWERSVKYAD